MSYDYTLIPKPSSLWKRLGARFGGEIGKMMTITEGLAGQPIGSIEEVKQQLSCVFPSLSWEQASFPDEIAEILAALPGEVKDWSWRTRGRPEISLGIDSQQRVRAIGVSRAAKRDVKLLAREFDLYAYDEQSGRVFSG